MEALRGPSFERYDAMMNTQLVLCAGKDTNTRSHSCVQEDRFGSGEWKYKLLLMSTEFLKEKGQNVAALRAFDSLLKCSLFESWCLHVRIYGRIFLISIH